MCHEGAIGARDRVSHMGIERPVAIGLLGSYGHFGEAADTEICAGPTID